ncbi:hypothetical protein Tsp_02298 [Trichinella spiralis]|uniref:hypothetical protein n=1 Tax=Trichinella spiralis TaxID=6334 RepID=UPI0001EFCCAE|nr:hypothetical protein Tsp_02298 [Trichinella spiralis]
MVSKPFIGKKFNKINFSSCEICETNNKLEWSPINIWKSVEQEIDIPLFLDYSVRILKFLDTNFKNPYKPSAFWTDTEQHVSTCGRTLCLASEQVTFLFCFRQQRMTTGK